MELPAFFKKQFYGHEIWKWAAGLCFLVVLLSLLGHVFAEDEYYLYPEDYESDDDSVTSEDFTFSDDFIEDYNKNGKLDDEYARRVAKQTAYALERRGGLVIREGDIEGGGMEEGENQDAAGIAREKREFSCGGTCGAKGKGLETKNKDVGVEEYFSDAGSISSFEPFEFDFEENFEDSDFEENDLSFSEGFED